MIWRNPEITTNEEFANVCLKNVGGGSILSAVDDPCVSSLVHEGPAGPLVPRSNLVGLPLLGVLSPGGVIPGEAGKS